MKKLLLITLLFCGILVNANQRITTRYENINHHIDAGNLQRVLIVASWYTKHTTFFFDESESDEYIILTASNYECSFFLRYNKTTHDCVIDFNACDNSFNYMNFKRIMDSFFLCG